MSTDLVRRAQAGDHDAFAALAAAAIGRLHRTARLILRDDERAADAVQDALLQAWLDIRAVRDPDRFEAWLNRVLVRSCYHEADRHRRRQSVEVPVEAIDTAGDPGDGRALAARDQVDRGFRRLTPEQRAALEEERVPFTPGAEAFADFLEQNPSLDTVSREALTIGGLPAIHIVTVARPVGAGAPCEEPPEGLYIWTPKDCQCHFLGGHDSLYIVDLPNGDTMMFEVSPVDETNPVERQVIDSIEIPGQLPGA